MIKAGVVLIATLGGIGIIDTSDRPWLSITWIVVVVGSTHSMVRDAIDASQRAAPCTFSSSGIAVRGHPELSCYEVAKIKDLSDPPFFGMPEFLTIETVRGRKFLTNKPSEDQCKSILSIWRNAARRTESDPGVSHSS